MPELFTNDLNGRFRVVLFAVLWLLWTQGAEAEVEHRVVSVGGALAEIIYELGGEAAIVGVDTTSTWPQAAAEHPQIGYQRNLSAEGVISLQPTLLLGTAEAGPPEVLDQIRSAGVEVFLFPERHTFEGVIERINVTAAYLGLESRGDQLVRRLQNQLNVAAGQIPSVDEKPNVLFLLSVGKGSPLAAGSGTSANAMIKLAGGRNVFAEMEGYKPVTAEAIISAAPEYLLVVDHRMDSDREAIIQQFLAAPGVKDTPAGKSKRVILMNGSRLLGFGPRMPSAVADLAAALYGVQPLSVANGVSDDR